MSTRKLAPAAPLTRFPAYSSHHYFITTFSPVSGGKGPGFRFYISRLPFVSCTRRKGLPQWLGPSEWQPISNLLLGSLRSNGSAIRPFAISCYFSKPRTVVKATVSHGWSRLNHHTISNYFSIPETVRLSRQRSDFGSRLRHLALVRCLEFGHENGPPERGG